MTNASRDDGTHQTTYEEVKDDENVILATVHDTQKTEVPLQSSSISSDFANQFLNLDNVSPVDNKVVSMMNVKDIHEEPNSWLFLLLLLVIKKSDLNNLSLNDLRSSFNFHNWYQESGSREILDLQVEDFVKRLRSTLREECDHYIEPTEFEDSSDG
nr:hypothetical protein [Tanacetum cinerariifolium]